MRISRYVAAVAAVALVAVGCSEDPTTTPTVGSSTQQRPAYAFDQVRHVVLEQHDTDAHEIVTLLAHLCAIDDAECPNGSEDVIILGSHQFLPHDVHLYDPDTVVSPPEDCLTDGTFCLLSLAHCEFGSAQDMVEAEHCVPDGGQIIEAAGEFDPSAHHECVDAQAEASRHVDLDCARTSAAETGQAPATDEETSQS